MLVRLDEVSLRFSRNGFDWDIHGTLVTRVGECRKDCPLQKRWRSLSLDGRRTSQYCSFDSRPGLFRTQCPKLFGELGIAPVLTH